MPETRSETALLVAFVDLTRFAAQSQRLGDVELADTIDAVIGKTVNTAVALEATGVALTVSAYRKLGPALRRRFKKHTPPVTYIRLEDRRMR